MSKNGVVCPVCGRHTFAESGDYDICPICFWENDGFQYENPSERGANRLSLSEYKKWWQKLNRVVPPLMQKYSVSKSHLASWAFDELVVPRENIKDFVNELTQNDIEIRLSFYNVCAEYSCDKNTFVPYPLIKAKSIQDINAECVSIVFSEEPERTCKKYGLKQVHAILKNTKYKHSLWLGLTPNICVYPNPDKV